jgi:hypothetical protein
VEELSRETGDVVHSYRINNGSPFVEGDDMQGRFRFKRSGKRISAYFWRGEWIEMYSQEYPANPVILKMWVRNWYARQSFAMEFDNFEIQTSYAWPSVPLQEFHDDFSDSAIDSRLTIAATAGIAAELDGRLYLEKLEGRSGYVRVELSAWEWILEGDFSVSFEFELIDFPGPGARPTRLALHPCSSHGGIMGEIRIETTPDGLIYRGRRHWGEARTECKDRKGRLRIGRRGTDILYEYWKDGWQQLFVSPDVDAELGMFFRIELNSSVKESVVVAIDNLSVTSD